MNPPALALSRIGQIAISTRDVPALAAFYRDVLGCKHLFDAGPDLVFFDCGGVRLMLSQPSAPEFDHASSILYFPVPDIDVAHRALVQAGVRIEEAPHLVAKTPDHELWMCFFRDPANNFLALICERR